MLDIFGRQIAPQLLPGKKIKQSDGVKHVEDWKVKRIRRLEGSLFDSTDASDLRRWQGE